MKFSKFGRLVLGLPILVLGACTLTGSAQSGYHLIKKVPLAAAPGGREYSDYITIDAATHRVYLSHGAEVQVLDSNNWSVVGTINGLQLCHGVVLMPELGKGFITDGEAAKVVIFDIKSLKVTGEVKTDQPDTDTIMYDQASKHIFSFNGDSKNMTVIDPVKEVVVKTVPLGGKVEFPVAGDFGTIYDNNAGTNEVTLIDSRALTVRARWPVAPAGQPVALAIDRKNRRLFSSGRGPQFLVMMDADNGKVIQSFPISAGVDTNIFDPETGMLFVSTREGMIHIFHEDSPDKLSEVETVKTEYGAKTMALDPNNHNLYLVTSDFDPPAAPSEKQPHPLPRAKPGNFRLLIYGR
jgi:DNA-binding beta-propeller fold protein YncE